MEAAAWVIKFFGGTVMRIITSPGGVVRALHPVQGVMDLKNAGFGSAVLDLNLFCHIEELWPGRRKLPSDALRNPDAIRAGYKAFLRSCQESHIELTVGRLPYLHILTERKDLDKRVWQLAVEGVHACEEAGCLQIIVPPLFAGVEPGREWEVNREYYLELAAVCENPRTQLLLKNQCRNIGDHLIRGNCAEAEEAVVWIDKLNTESEEAASRMGKTEDGTERFGFCMDVGAYNICGQDMHEIAAALGNYVKAVIVRDNNGQTDDALLPFTCCSSGNATNWLGLLRGLRDMGFDGNLIIDFKDTAKAFSPLLRPGLLTLAKTVADYFAWQLNLEGMMKRYESVVLFGAGNMCRNYMKNYGEKYPPLFTCDNSPARWGEVFCGLEVRPPEALQELPENCGVFICNIYYREIEEQLKKMGIKNIEFFNDEYLPAFHMDRLEMR